MNRRQLAARAGMLGSALFVALFSIEGWLRPGYDAKTMFISELSLGPRGWIQIANFIVLGVLFLIFARGVAAEFREGKASRFGPLLLTIIGFSFLVSGPLVMDPTWTPLDQVSWHGVLHGIFGALVFSLSPATCFVFLRRFRVDPKWHSMVAWTLLAAVITTVAVVLLTVTSKLPTPPQVLRDWLGVIQRALIIPFLAWSFIFAFKLSKQQ